jgi:hypothetical protein
LLHVLFFLCGDREQELAMAIDRDAQPSVELDSSRLLGFNNLARVLVEADSPSVADVARMLSKIGIEVPPPGQPAGQSRVKIGRLLSKISEIVPV